MKVEDCIVTVERRSLGGCLDLAFVFGREFAGPLFRLWLLCSAPCCVMVWLMASYSTDMLIPSLVVFSFFCSVFSALLVACIGPQVFGVPISVRSAVQTVRRRFWGLCLLTGILRFFQCISGFCLIVPSAFVTAYGGHVPEVLLLEQAPVTGVTSRLTWLGAGGGYYRSFLRVLALFAYWAAMATGLFLMMDLVCTVLLHRPLFLARVMHRTNDLARVALQLTHDDPAFLTAVQLSIWVPYPVIRLTWFFCYLDQRIRNECWDLQLHFRAEAARLDDAR